MPEGAPEIGELSPNNLAEMAKMFGHESKPPIVPVGETEKKGTSQVNQVLGLRHEEYVGGKEHGRTKILADLRELITANVDDVNPPKGEKIDDEKKAELLALGDMHKTLVDMLAGEDVGERAQLIKEYILAKADEDTQTGGKNMDTFKAFMGIVPEKFRSEEEMKLFETPKEEPQIADKPEEKKSEARTNEYDDERETKAEIAEVQGIKEANRLPDPEAITSKLAADALDALKSKEKIGLTDVKDFMGSIASGLPKGDKELQDAVTAAKEFYKEHSAELKKGRKIMVTVSGGKIQEVAWQRRFFGKHRRTKGAKYVFNPSSGSEDPRSLDRQEWAAFQADARREIIMHTSTVIDKLISNQGITAEEKLSVFQQLEQYARDTENGKGSAQAKEERLAILEKLSKAIDSASPHNEDLPVETPIPNAAAREEGRELVGADQS
jgi:hypothetical protein